MKHVCKALMAVVLLLLTGCAAGTASSGSCLGNYSFGVSTINPATGVSQATGSADHALPAPGNQAKFNADRGPGDAAGCAAAQIIAPVSAQWTLSDNIDATISSANDATNGLATCVGTTLTPTVVTATYLLQGVTKTASTTLTCK